MNNSLINSIHFIKHIITILLIFLNIFNWFSNESSQHLTEVDKLYLFVLVFILNKLMTIFNSSFFYGF